jgi:hypothetical protein
MLETTAVLVDMSILGHERVVSRGFGRAIIRRLGISMRDRLPFAEHSDSTGASYCWISFGQETVQKRVGPVTRKTLLANIAIGS